MAENTAPGQPSGPRIPVTVLTGCLGAGKTTVLRQLLARAAGERIAVVENEFGMVGVDGALLADGAGGVWELTSGCLCCSSRADLVEVLEELTGTCPLGPFDRVVVETTGLADPGAVAQILIGDRVVSRRVCIDSVVTVVDACHIGAQLDEPRPARTVNEATVQLELADLVLVSKTDRLAPGGLEAVLTQLRKVNSWAEIIPVTRGVIAPERVLGLGAFDLGRVLARQPGFLEREHHHDPAVEAVSLEVRGEARPERINPWLAGLVESYGTSILRMKGILNIAGRAERYLLGGVRMLLDGEWGPAWGAGDARLNRMVFIGRDLAPADLRDRFEDVIEPVSGRRRPQQH